MDEFRDRVAVVTGGASGVGRALVTQLAEAGAIVVLVDVDAAAVARETDALRARGLSVEGEVCDVTSEAAVAALADAVFGRHRTVHLLFNNAGVGVKEAARRIWTLPVQDWSWAYAVNVMGVVHGIKAFLPRMLERGEPGHVVNTTSGNGGIAPLPTTPIYASSKAAVTSLTEVLHAQLEAEGAKVRAHLLFPGPFLVNTNILNSDRVRGEQFKGPGHAPSGYVDMKALAASAGVDFQLTEPEEVATMALDGVREGRFWILSRLGKSDENLRARTESILARENPKPR